MPATKKQIEEFITMMIPIAKRQAKKHGYKIYASVCIAQAAHESGWGTSAKMKNANALFGVKVGKSAWHFGNAWKDKAYKTGTHEYYNGKKEFIQDYFREYDSVEDATEDYMDLLCTASRYKGALNQPTPKKCIEAIVAGGYATGPDYAKHIMQTINAHNLTRHDTPLEYYPKYRGDSQSIVIALENIGVDASFNHRKEIYGANCAGEYRGSEKQNLELVRRIKAGELIKE